MDKFRCRFDAGEKRASDAGPRTMPINLRAIQDDMAARWPAARVEISGVSSQAAHVSSSLCNPVLSAASVQWSG